MKFLDCFSAGILFVMSIVDCLLVPRAYTGRIWIFGAGLALLFTAMLNVLRIRNGRGVKSLRLSCITANVTMLDIHDRADGKHRKSTNARALAYTSAGSPAAGRDCVFAGEERLIPIQEAGNGVTFAVKVHPRAKKNAITGELGDALKLSLTTPPLEGRANEACIEFFAKLLKVPRSSVTIASGQTSRQKVIRVSGLSAEEVRRRFGNDTVVREPL